MKCRVLISNVGRFYFNLGLRMGRGEYADWSQSCLGMACIGRMDRCIKSSWSGKEFPLCHIIPAMHCIICRFSCMNRLPVGNLHLGHPTDARVKTLIRAPRFFLAQIDQEASIQFGGSLPQCLILGQDKARQMILAKLTAPYVENDHQILPWFIVVPIGHNSLEGRL